MEWGRYGTAALRPLYLRRCSARKVLTRRIRAALQWFIKALCRFWGKAIAIGLQSQPLYITISDGVGRGSVAVGVWCQRGKAWIPRGIAPPVPEEIQASWLSCTTQSIASIGAVGPLLALASWTRLAGRLWIHFVDDTNARGALVTGPSGSHELASNAPAA